MEYQNALEFVMSYYEKTWNNLLWLLGASLVIVGIAIPLIAQWLQSKNNKIQKDGRIECLSKGRSAKWRLIR